jgi:hypothetical protein
MPSGELGYGPSRTHWTHSVSRESRLSKPSSWLHAHCRESARAQISLHRFGPCWLELCDRVILEAKGGRLRSAPQWGQPSSKRRPEPSPDRCSEVFVERLTERFSICRNHSGGSNTRFISGAFTVEESEAKSIVASLPRLLHVNSAQFPILEWLHCSIRLLMFESQLLAQDGSPRSRGLTDMMLFQVIRSWKEQYPSDKSGGVAAHNDPAIDRAISLITSEPAFPWTIASLAKEVDYRAPRFRNDSLVWSAYPSCSMFPTGACSLRNSTWHPARKALRKWRPFSVISLGPRLAARLSGREAGPPER